MPYAYLDIETDFHRQPTVVGVAFNGGAVAHLVGTDITAQRLCDLLPVNATVVTFNGFCFDLPVLKSAIGIDIRTRYDCVDLRFLGQKLRFTGSQKDVEKLTGYRRTLTDLDGRDAVRLWSRSLRGDPQALPTLLAYNREDVLGLRHLRGVFAGRTLSAAKTKRVKR